MSIGASLFGAVRAIGRARLGRPTIAPHSATKRLAALFVVGEHVVARTPRREDNHIARRRISARKPDRIVDVVGERDLGTSRGLPMAIDRSGDVGSRASDAEHGTRASGEATPQLDEVGSLPVIAADNDDQRCIEGGHGDIQRLVEVRRNARHCLPCLLGRFVNLVGIRPCREGAFEMIAGICETIHGVIGEGEMVIGVGLEG